MEIILDGACIESIKELHRWFAKQLDFPPYYGGNFSALYDCLTDLSRPVVLRLRGWDLLEQSLGGGAAGLLRVLEDAAAENPNLTLTFTEK